MTPRQEKWLRRLRHVAAHYRWQLGTRGDWSNAIRGLARDGTLIACPITATCNPPLKLGQIDQAAIAQDIERQDAAEIVRASDGFPPYDGELRNAILKAVGL